MSKKILNFQDKLTQLDELLEWFESGEVTLEKAPEKYQVALQLINELEGQLTQTKNKITILQKKV